MVKLGFDVINIEVSERQIDLSIDDCLLDMWRLNTSEGSYLHYFMFQTQANVGEYCLSGLGIQDAYDIDLSFAGGGINTLFSPMNMMFYQDWVANGNFPGLGGKTPSTGGAIGGSQGLQMTEYNIGMQYLKLIKNQMTALHTVKWHAGREILEVVPAPKSSSVGMLALYIRQDERDLYNNKNFRDLCVARTGVAWASNLTKFSGQLPDGSTISSSELIQRYSEKEETVLERIRAGQMMGFKDFSKRGMMLSEASRVMDDFIDRSDDSEIEKFKKDFADLADDDFDEDDDDLFGNKEYDDDLDEGVIKEFDASLIANTGAYLATGVGIVGLSAGLLAIKDLLARGWENLAPKIGRELLHLAKELEAGKVGLNASEMYRLRGLISNLRTSRDYKKTTPEQKKLIDGVLNAMTSIHPGDGRSAKELGFELKKFINRMDDFSVKSAQGAADFATSFDNDLDESKKTEEDDEIDEGVEDVDGEERPVCVTELATELGYTEDDITLVEDDGGSITAVWFGDEEYRIAQDDSSADELAMDYIRDLYDEMGPESFSPEFVKHYVTVSETDARIIAGEEVDNRYEDEDDRDEDAEMEEAAEIADKIENDPIGYFCDELGLYTEEELMKQNFIMIDTDRLFKDAIDQDGRGHFISSYDGDEIELPCGAYAYRIN